jgi:UDP-2,3-diacylglucosamine pyrophosphatase LpxH
MILQILRPIYAGFRRSMQWLLTRPVTWLANKISSAPQKQQVFDALSKLYAETIEKPGEKKGTLLSFKPGEQSIIIFSDHHKGARNGADDFTTNEANYLAALAYYDSKKFYYINLGDSEELWENNILAVLRHNKASFAAEKKFADRHAYCKIYGNHDTLWRFDPLAQAYLKQMYGQPLKTFGGIVLRASLQDQAYIDLFCTHGHQGDAQSDGNWFSAWVVSNIWGPLQRFLRINPNTPSCNNERKTTHNQYMYAWSAAQKNLVLVTGHTHQPVFNSLTHLERLYLQLEEAQSQGDHVAIASIEGEIPRRQQEYDHVSAGYRSMKPTYFNTGCCCFSDGNITGIEICDGFIRLVKWSTKNGSPQRVVAEESQLADLAKRITS